LIFSYFIHILIGKLAKLTEAEKFINLYEHFRSFQGQIFGLPQRERENLNKLEPCKEVPYFKTFFSKEIPSNLGSGDSPSDLGERQLGN
jgi:hypothetical protein